MNKRRRDNITKLLYDLVRLSFIGLIAGGVVKERISLAGIVIGVILAVVFFAIAYYLDGKGDE